jgi:hypothetical protein
MTFPTQVPVRPVEPPFFGVNPLLAFGSVAASVPPAIAGTSCPDQPLRGLEYVGMGRSPGQDQQGEFPRPKSTHGEIQRDVHGRITWLS